MVRLTHSCRRRPTSFNWSKVKRLTSRRAGNVAVVLFVAFSLVTNSTPAAAQTLVQVATESHANVSFWLLANQPLRRLFNWLGAQQAPIAQEKQADRDARVHRIEILPGDVQAEERQIVNFAAVAYDKDDEPVSGVAFRWSARDEGRNRNARISQRGEFTSEGAGNFKVSVEGAGRTASVTVKVGGGKERRKGDDKPLEIKTTSSRDLPPEAQAAAGKSKQHDAGVNDSASKAEAKARFAHARPANAKTSTNPTAMPMWIDDGWGPDNYYSFDDPGNTRGNPPGGTMDQGAGSGNFKFATPVTALGGRGMNLSLALSYNSRMWNKAGTKINYDIDRDWPAPGWNLGVGKLMALGVYIGGMLVDGDGTRHPYTGSITVYNWGTTFVGKTTDGSFIDYTYTSGAGGPIVSATATLSNGTVINYNVQGTAAVYPTMITDAQGNYITITYVNNQGPRIQTITDTMGRLINFHYDSNNLLTAVTAPGLGGGTRTLVRLHYSQLALNYSFSGLTPVVRDSFPWVIDGIYYPGTNNGYWLTQADNSYSTYGMLKKVSVRRNMSFSGPAPVPIGQGTTGQGTMTAGSVTSEEVYNYPLNTSDTTGTQASGLTDAPTYTSCVETWTRDGTNFDSATTTYAVNQNSSPRTVTITSPSGTISKQYSYNSPGSFQDGLIYLDETISGTTVLQSSSTVWAQGAYSSPRPTTVTATNERGQSTTTQYSYGSVYNQVTDIRNYDYGGTTLLSSTRTTYQNSSNYTNRHIFNLPLVIEMYGPDNVTRLTRTEYQYDGQPLTDTPGVIMHDESFNPNAESILIPGNCWWDCPDMCYYVCDPDYYWNPYNPATDYRGNITQVTTYANGQNLTTPITETRRYDINGNLIKANTSCCAQTSLTYDVSNYYAYAIAKTSGSATDGFSQIKTTATFDFNTGLELTNTDANGRTSQATYDSVTLRPLTKTNATGSHTDFSYDDAGLNVTQTTYLESHPTHTTIAAQSIKFADGRGQVRQEKTLGAGGVWDIVDTVFDSSGRLTQQSLPYRTGNTVYWNTQTYDALNRIATAQTPDGSVTQNFYNETSKPSVASSSPGETIRIVDPWGRERWARNDAQGRLVEVIEPDPNGTGSVASNGMATTYTYNSLGKITAVTQGSQTRSFKYDSLGRLVAQKLAEASATLNDAGTYVGSGTWSDVFVYDDRSNVISRTDARGVKTSYTYNNDPLNRLQSVSFDTTGFGDTANPILPAATITYQYRTKSTASELKDVTQTSGVTVSGVSTEAFSFDTEGRISARTLTLTSRSSYPFVTDYIYDTVGRMTDIRYPAEYGNGAQVRKLVHHNFDVASRLTGLTVDGTSHASNVVFNAASQTTSLNVGVSGVNQVTENYSYSANTGLISNQTITRNGSTLLNLSYDFANANGKVTQQLVKITNNLDSNKNRGYEYDAVGRLKRATGGQNVNWAQRYLYDRYGNRTFAFSHTADQYIRNFYLKALARQPNSTELNSWLSTLQTAYAQGSSQFWTAMQNLGAAVFTSQEYANRNRDNHWYVYDLYQAYLWRDPDAGGWANWETNTAVNGRNATRAGFDWSVEFETHVSGTSPYSPPGGGIVLPDGWGSLHYEVTNNRINDGGWGYDAAGNQTRVFTASGWQRYQYDAANRMVRVKADDNTTVLSSVVYSDDNQRLIREEGGTRTYYAADEDAVLAEYVETGGSTVPAWSKSYVYLGERLLSTLTPNGSGGAAVSYHHPDRLGTRVVSNAQNTTTFEQVTLPFGTPLDNESTGTTNRRFTSYDRSATTGLDYAMNRSYDSLQGRFTQIDPIEMDAASLANPQTMNLYTYCGNDPVNNLDPTGLFFGKLFKWIGKILKILAIVALVVMTLIVFAPASSFLFKAALWMFFHVLIPLSQIPVLGGFVPLGMMQSPQWNPKSRSIFGNSWQDPSPCPTPPDCQDYITLPPVSAGDIYANYSNWEKVKWGLNIGGEKALNAVVGFSDTITLNGSQWLTKKWASYLAGFDVSKTVEQDHLEMQKSWFYTGGEIGGLAWDIAMGGKTVATKAPKLTKYVGKYVFRLERGSWKLYGKMVYNRIHFHLGPGRGLMKHHLPYEFYSWRKHFWNNLKKWRW
jgi:RHS repeat-associated protein